MLIIERLSRSYKFEMLKISNGSIAWVGTLEAWTLKSFKISKSSILKCWSCVRYETHSSMQDVKNRESGNASRFKSAISCICSRFEKKEQRFKSSTLQGLKILRSWNFPRFQYSKVQNSFYLAGVVRMNYGIEHLQLLFLMLSSFIWWVYSCFMQRRKRNDSRAQARGKALPAVPHGCVVCGSS